MYNKIESIIDIQTISEVLAVHVEVVLKLITITSIYIKTRGEDSYL